MDSLVFLPHGFPLGIAVILFASYNSFNVKALYMLMP